MAIETMVSGGSGAQPSGFQIVPRISLAGRVKGTEWAAQARAQGAPWRRKVSPQAGRAIEVLSHAIEYLSDEFALESLSGNARGEAGCKTWRSQVAAIDLLKRLNREVFLSCPLVPTLGERLTSLLHRRQSAGPAIQPHQANEARQAQ